MQIPTTVEGCNLLMLKGNDLSHLHILQWSH